MTWKTNNQTCIKSGRGTSCWLKWIFCKYLSCKNKNINRLSMHLNFISISWKKNICQKENFLFHVTIFIDITCAGNRYMSTFTDTYIQVCNVHEFSQWITIKIFTNMNADKWDTVQNYNHPDAGSSFILYKAIKRNWWKSASQNMFMWACYCMTQISKFCNPSSKLTYAVKSKCKNQIGRNSA
jgi:hypothetical protein